MILKIVEAPTVRCMVHIRSTLRAVTSRMMIQDLGCKAKEFSPWLI